MIDFHCHLDLYPNPKQVVAEIQAAGIYVLSVTTTPKAWKKTVELSGGVKRIRTALGIHPQLAHERRNELPLFEVLLPDTRYVGEVGLDGSSDYRQHAGDQLHVFERILAISQEQGGRIFTIHSRNAAGNVLETLEKYPNAGPPILHWFTGTEKQLDRAIGMGCWFSVGPAMLHSQRGRKLVQIMPKDRILTETDGPFAKLASRPLHPLDCWVAVDQLAKGWGANRSAVQQQLTSNLRNLVNLIPPEERRGCK